MREYLLVPQEDIDALERAKLDLDVALSRLNEPLVFFTHITNPIHKLTRTKYRKVLDYAEPDLHTGD